jgi:hypothetical protein
MALVPIRGLGQSGLVCDQDGFVLEPAVLTTARNVRFDGARVTSGTAFRVYKGVLRTSAPVFAYTISNPGSFDRVLIADLTARLFSITPTSETDVTPSSWSPLAADTPWSACSLGGVTYVSRADMAPVRMLPGDPAFAPLVHWDPSWRCAVLRSYRDCLVAMALTEGGSFKPGRVRWSEFAQAGQEPSTWADNDPTVNSGNNYLAELRSPIVDGMSLGQDFYIYSGHEVWRMQLVGGQEVMTFSPAFNDFGLLNTNCVVQVDGQHICFGLEDIIAHDGVQKKSIAENRVRQRIYSSINWTGQSRAFVVHDKSQHEVWFCYRSHGDDVYWGQGDYCTEAAVWNYVTDAWCFRDLPNVGAAAAANATSGVSWGDLKSSSWAGTRRSWGAGQSAGQRVLVFPSVPSPVGNSAKMLVADGFGVHQTLNFPVYTSFQPDSKVGRERLNLDALGGDTKAYQRVRSLLPLVAADNLPVYGQVTAALYPNQPVRTSVERSLNPSRGYKMDLLAGGRHVGWSLRVPGTGYFALSGLDLDVVPKGRR